jgi:hypothetical protein
MKILAISILLFIASANAFSSIGCFDGTGINWLRNGVKLSLANCQKKCSASKMPLLAMKNSNCYCGSDVPSYLTQKSCAGNYAFFYVYNGRCNVPYASINSWYATYNWDRIKFLKENSVQIRLQQQSGATMTHWQYNRFGLSCMKIKVSGVSGAISAFYLSNNAQGKQEEVDIEFINAKPCIGGGCLWLNQFIAGKERSPLKIESSTLKRILGNTFSVSNTYHNYCIDRQPNKITWYIDNKFVRSTTTYIPQAYMAPFITLWTDIGHRFNWGGTIPYNAPPVYSYFADFRKVVCN